MAAAAPGCGVSGGVLCEGKPPLLRALTVAETHRARHGQQQLLLADPTARQQHHHHLPRSRTTRCVQHCPPPLGRYVVRHVCGAKVRSGAPVDSEPLGNLREGYEVRVVDAVWCGTWRLGFDAAALVGLWRSLGSACKVPPGWGCSSRGWFSLESNAGHPVAAIVQLAPTRAFFYDAVTSTEDHYRLRSDVEGGAVPASIHYEGIELRDQPVVQPSGRLSRLGTYCDGVSAVDAQGMSVLHWIKPGSSACSRSQIMWQWRTGWSSVACTARSRWSTQATPERAQSRPRTRSASGLGWPSASG